MGNTEQVAPSGNTEQVASHVRWSPTRADANSLSNFFMSKEELADELDVHVSALLRWHNLGIGPRRSKVGRVIRYSCQEVEDFFKANAVVAAAGSQAAPDSAGVTMTKAMEALSIPGRATSVGLTLPTGLSYEGWLAVVAKLKLVTRASMWWGDALNYGERNWGEK